MNIGLASCTICKPIGRYILPFFNDILPCFNVKFGKRNVQNWEGSLEVGTIIIRRKI